MAAISLANATKEVAQRDPRLAKAIARLGPLKHSPRDPDGPFGALVRAIVYQQLAGSAAGAIYSRVRATVGPTLTPDSLADASAAQLRHAGLSANKLASLRDLAAKVIDGSVVITPAFAGSDQELIEQLTTVRGIGTWTAHLYLLFQLRRVDIWPIGDLGVRRGYALIWGLPAIPHAKELDGLGDRFRPYRSVIARYCWAALAEQRAQVLPTATKRKETAMSHATPDVVNNYFAMDARHDLDGLLALFADDAVVVDEGQTMEGHDAIRAWRVEGSAAKYSYTTEVTRIEEVEPDRCIAAVRLTGNFPGGIADVRYAFRLSNGWMKRLVIAP